MRKKIIAANWKMNMTVGETEGFFKPFLLEIGSEKRADVVIIPPFTALAKAGEILRNVQNVKLGAQNMSAEKSGAFTGEISAGMIKDAGAGYVIIGHSERRRLFGETDTTVARKVVAAIGAGLTPIVCVGETLEERERNETFAVLDRQIKEGLDQLTAAQIAELVVAYEPVWAIGTGRNATAAQAGEVHAHIRQRVGQWFGAPAADQCHVIYGGSVKADNIAELIREPDVDGALVGGASLDVRSFVAIVTRSRSTAV